MVSCTADYKPKSPNHQLLICSPRYWIAQQTAWECTTLAPHSPVLRQQTRTQATGVAGAWSYS